METGNYINYFLGFLAFMAVMIFWVLWEIHQKLHKLLDVTWSSCIAFEKRLDDIIKKLRD